MTMKLTLTSAFLLSKVLAAAMRKRQEIKNKRLKTSSGGSASSLLYTETLRETDFSFYLFICFCDLCSKAVLAEEARGCTMKRDSAHLFFHTIALETLPPPEFRRSQELHE